MTTWEFEGVTEYEMTLAEWEAFASVNGLDDPDDLRAAMNGGLEVGGGAAPLFVIYVSE